MATCFLIALIAARLGPEFARRRVALAGLWLATLCPFTANYAAVALTETLVTFLTALAILVLLEAYLGAARATIAASLQAQSALSPWFLAGVIVGFGALVRPETPLLLMAAGLALLAKWWRPLDWAKLARASALMGLGLLLPLPALGRPQLAHRFTKRNFLRLATERPRESSRLLALTHGPALGSGDLATSISRCGNSTPRKFPSTLFPRAHSIRPKNARESLTFSIPTTII